MQRTSLTSRSRCARRRKVKTQKPETSSLTYSALVTTGSALGQRKRIKRIIPMNCVDLMLRLKSVRTLTIPRHKLTDHSDFEHYLSLQVLPPVERLCDQIEGTERSRLAECLGTLIHAYLNKYL